MNERLEAEIALLRASGCAVDVGRGYAWIVVKGMPLPEGWNRTETDILVKIRPGYPTTPPDNFYAAGDLRLGNGKKPGNAPKEETISGRNWLLFSHHVQKDSWSPHAELEQGHNLLTYLNTVRGRLEEAN